MLFIILGIVFSASCVITIAVLIFLDRPKESLDSIRFNLDAADREYSQIALTDKTQIGIVERTELEARSEVALIDRDHYRKEYAKLYKKGLKRGFK